MSAPTVKTASAANETSAIDAIVLAFSADPVARWTWSDPRLFLLHFPHFTRAFGGRAFTHDTAYYVGGYVGAALWLAPGVEPDAETLMALLRDTASDQSRRDAPAVMEQMGRFHPTEPHWFLPVIGVDPLHQGKGFGSALMKRSLEAVDREHEAAYLESTSPQNIPLYERHGFELLGTVQVGSSPPIFPMLRRAR